MFAPGLAVSTYVNKAAYAGGLPLYELGRRWGRHLDNAMNGAANNLGPEIIGVTEGTDYYELEIVMPSLLFPAPEWPQTFALLAPGTAIGQTPKAIKRFSYSLSGGTWKLRIFPLVFESGLRVAYPYGKGTLLRGGRIIDANFLPLRTYGA